MKGVSQYFSLVIGIFVAIIVNIYIRFRNQIMENRL